MHFFYGFGAFLTPIVIKLFNSDSDDVEKLLECIGHQEISKLHPGGHKLVTGTSSESNDKSQQVSDLQHHGTDLTFWILALIQLPAPLAMLYVRFYTPRTSSANVAGEYQDLDEEAIENKPVGSNLPQPVADHHDYEIGFNLGFFKSLTCNAPVFKMTCLVAATLFFLEGILVNYLQSLFNYVFFLS